jgi:hypothetical protein
MAKKAMATGALLMALGFGFFFLDAQSATGDKGPSVTALIPSFFGVLLLALGLVARDDNRRKQAMHIAAGVSLLGILGSLMSVRKWPQILTGQAVERPLAAWEQMLMFLICATFLALCVKSFKEARRSAG